MGSQVLQESASNSVAMLDAIEQDKASPALLDRAKGIIMLWGTKMGFGLGGRMGSGFILAKLPPAAPNEPERWSAPLFVKVRVAELGLCFGFATIKTWLVAMGPKILEEMETKGSHSLVGLDQTFTMAHDKEEVKTDVIALSSGTPELLGASTVTGVMMDFSFAGGSMQVDTSKLEAVYGAGTTAAAVLGGQVAPPPEMEPVYSRLNALIASGHRVSVNAVRVSLERMTAGYDPDRRMVSSHSGKLLHSGESNQAISAREL